jgi:hypothetical protein
VFIMASVRCAPTRSPSRRRQGPHANRTCGQGADDHVIFLAALATLGSLGPGQRLVQYSLAGLALTVAFELNGSSFSELREKKFDHSAMFSVASLERRKYKEGGRVKKV